MVADVDYLALVGILVHSTAVADTHYYIVVESDCDRRESADNQMVALLHDAHCRNLKFFLIRFVAIIYEPRVMHLIFPFFVGKILATY